MEYVINVLSTNSEHGRNDYGFYNGKCYMYQNEYYPCFSSRVVDESVKKYSSAQRAKQSAKSVINKCGLVKGYEIYELTDEGIQLIYRT